MFLPLLLTLLAQQAQVPAPTGYVNDNASVLDAQSRREIQAIIDEVRQKSRGEIVVVTVTDLGGRPSIDVARDIGRQWRVGAAGGAGDRARNAGVILLFKPGRRPGDGQADVAIATGSGAEGFITDAQAGRIRDAIGRQSVESSSYARGLVEGVALLGRAYATEFGFQVTGTQPVTPVRGSSSRLPIVFIIRFMMFMFFIMSRARRGRRGGIGNALFWALISSGHRRSWSGASHGGGWKSSGGGGFGGFGGGGGFSGGGASGRF